MRLAGCCPPGRAPSHEPRLGLGLRAAASGLALVVLLTQCPRPQHGCPPGRGRWPTWCLRSCSSRPFSNSALRARPPAELLSSSCCLSSSSSPRCLQAQRRSVRGAGGGGVAGHGRPLPGGTWLPAGPAAPSPRPPRGGAAAEAAAGPAAPAPAAARSCRWRAGWGAAPGIPCPSNPAAPTAKAALVASVQGPQLGPMSCPRLLCPSTIFSVLPEGGALG